MLMLSYSCFLYSRGEFMLLPIYTYLYLMIYGGRGGKGQAAVKLVSNVFLNYPAKRLPSLLPPLAVFISRIYIIKYVFSRI
jgi:hypothetical protein